jgi:hypothetical protein
MILAPRNSDVSKVNDDVLGKMTGEQRVYYSADKKISEAGAEVEDDEPPLPIEFLRALSTALRFRQENLCSKLGAR